MVETHFYRDPTAHRVSTDSELSIRPDDLQQLVYYREL